MLALPKPLRLRQSKESDPQTTGPLTAALGAKNMVKFPALFEKDEGGGYVVTFRDIPEAITQ
jgi:hypothetical protein